MNRHASMGVAGAASYAWLQWLGRTNGSTPAERHRLLPGDELCPRPHAVTTHAITINAPPGTRVALAAADGWGRGQWYTARWVDRLLFPANAPSAERIVPELQDLKVGDRILDGPPDANCSFLVEQLVPNHHLLLHSREHLPPGWAERFGATINFTWVFVLDNLCDGRTRFIFRSRSRIGPRWVAAFYLAAMVPTDFVMSPQMLRGVKARAERTPWLDPDRRHERAVVSLSISSQT
jgi:hypothetical protein